MYGKTSERSEQGYIFAPGELRSARPCEAHRVPRGVGAAMRPGQDGFGDFPRKESHPFGVAAPAHPCARGIRASCAAQGRHAPRFLLDSGHRLHNLIFG